MMPNTAWIWQGYGRDMARTPILNIESKVLDTIRLDALPIFKYPGIIGQTYEVPVCVCEWSVIE